MSILMAVTSDGVVKLDPMMLTFSSDSSSQLLVCLRGI